MRIFITFISLVYLLTANTNVNSKEMAGEKMNQQKAAHAELLEKANKIVDM
jgi:hypothetical protein